MNLTMGPFKNRTVRLCRNIVSLANPAAWTKQTIDAVTPAIASQYLPKILTSQVYEAAHETNLAFAPNLSTLLKNEVYLKREDTQPVFSFKIRGAYNKISKLSLEQRESGVVTCSAGNHAQGVALSASKLGINATIVMPLATPLIKVNAVRRFGGPTVTVKLHGQNYDEAAAEASRLVKEQGLTLIHPFDDEDVIAGQGTIGMEILKVDIDNLNKCRSTHESRYRKIYRVLTDANLTLYLPVLVVVASLRGFLHM